MKKNISAILFILSLLPSNAYAQNNHINIKVDISEQKMYVYQDNIPKYEWIVSTARKRKITPRGKFFPKFLSKNHKSSLYNNAPMPYSIFYSGNYAIHGTLDVEKLGNPASAGCVRLHPDNAAILFDLVKDTTFKNVEILIQD